MTEADWLASTVPSALLAHARAAGLATDRKVRLFAVGCCRLVWHLLEPASRKHVGVAERVADGEATDVERADAFAEAQERATYASGSREYGLLDVVRVSVMRKQLLGRHVGVWREFDEVLPPARQADLVRDVFAPFATARAWESVYEGRCRRCGGKPRGVRSSVGGWVTCPRCKGSLHESDRRPLPWLTPLAQQMAHDAYNARDWGILPILADQIEDAGCTDAVLLEHLRSGGLHTRGCWVVDLLTGRE